MYGISEPSVAHAMITGASMRRRASMYVHAISAIQTATSISTKRFAARFRPSFEMPKIANGMAAALRSGAVYFVAQSTNPVRNRAHPCPLKEQPPENVADSEEDE